MGALQGKGADTGTGGIGGPFNRRNVYGAVFAYAPVLEANPLTRPMFCDG